MIAGIIGLIIAFVIIKKLYNYVYKDADPKDIDSAFDWLN
jgi:hypothetical protein